MAWRENAVIRNLTITGQLHALGGVFPNPYGAIDYFVDGNVSVSGNGLGWGGGEGKTSRNTPFQSLSEAIAASNITIAKTANRWWARRNRIFACGDQELTENLTIFPEKCDIIGVGYDVEAMPALTGNHTIAAIGTGLARSTRWSNFRFRNNSAGETIHLTTDHMAVEFHGCDFEPLSTGSTHAIRLADDNRGFKFINSRILISVAGSPAAGIFAEGIKVEGNGQHDMIIHDNFIHATEGIHIVAATAGYNGVISENTIRATDLTVNDVSGLFILTDNKLFTDADPTTDLSGAVVSAIALAANNRVSSTDGTERNAPYPKEVIT